MITVIANQANIAHFGTNFDRHWSALDLQIFNHRDRVAILQDVARRVFDYRKFITRFLTHILVREKVRSLANTTISAFALVAQWIERRFPEPQVACSIHAGGTQCLPTHRHHCVWFSRFHKRTVVEVDVVALPVTPVVIIARV